MVVVRQLMRSSLSIGANVVEGRNSSSKLEFKRYYEIALKSANESKYWMCLLRDAFEVKEDDLIKLLKETNELSRILAASVLKLKRLNR
jgi:four helix bundle protein